MVCVHGVRVCVCVRMRMPAFFCSTFWMHHYPFRFSLCSLTLYSCQQTCIFRQEIIICEHHRRSRNSFCVLDFKVKIACDSLTVSHSQLACCWFSTGGAVQSVSGQFFAHVIVRHRWQVGLDEDTLMVPPTVNNHVSITIFLCTFWSDGRGWWKWPYSKKRPQDQLCKVQNWSKFIYLCEFAKNIFTMCTLLWITY